MDQSRTMMLQEFHLPSARRVKAQRSRISFPVGKLVAFILLTVFCIAWISPFFVLFLLSLRSSKDAVYSNFADINSPLEAIKLMFIPPNGYGMWNYRAVLLGEFEGQHITLKVEGTDLLIWTLNSIGSAVGGTFLYLVVASITAYAFTFIDFKFRNVLFAILVGSMVIPGVATQVGNQSNIFSWGWQKIPLIALILPGLSGVYGMYLIKTFFTGIPKDLIESAKMDGYSNLKIFTKIVLPLGKTVIFVQGLFGFMGGWNDLIWPNMLYGSDVNNKKLWTLQVGINYLLNSNRSADTIGTSLAGGVICVLPVLIVYLFTANKIVEGMATAGVKR